jgi:hypothetical protein
MRSDLLAEIGKWRDSDVMDGSDFPEPSASLKRLLSKAQQQNFDVDVFGRFYSEGNGIHDTHLNQGLIKASSIAMGMTPTITTISGRMGRHG